MLEKVTGSQDRHCDLSWFTGVIRLLDHSILIPCSRRIERRNVPPGSAGEFRPRVSDNVPGVLHVLICKNEEDHGLVSLSSPSNAVGNVNRESWFSRVFIAFLHATCTTVLVYRLRFAHRPGVLTETTVRKDLKW